VAEGAGRCWGTRERMGGDGGMWGEERGCTSLCRAMALLCHGTVVFAVALRGCGNVGGGWVCGWVRVGVSWRRRAALARARG